MLVDRFPHAVLYRLEGARPSARLLLLPRQTSILRRYRLDFLQNLIFCA